ncbi:MAG: DUF3783 domain-containing protein [Oscillospiraceae bacterium]|nr:DUF3783 domain-containing protein [Oscillospiraceae bacterium]
MKARIMNTPPERVLIYGFDEEQQTKFREVCRIVKSELCIIPENRAGEQTGFLAGFSGFSERGADISDSRQCVVFSCMDRKKLEKTVDCMRENGLGGIPLKAAVTAFNQKMTLSELMDELEKEHRQMHGE